MLPLRAQNVKMPMNSKKAPSTLVSFIPLLVLVAMLGVTISLFGDAVLSGGSQVCLLLAAAVCVALGMWRYGISWQDFEQAIEKNVKRVSVAMFILLLIGALSGMWMVSGVVPTMICYGIDIIHPSLFLFCTCVVCALVSVMTGSSWTTVATIGIALLGVGQAQGFHEGWVAGAIISGAYFGDKMSPLSDTTVLASSAVGVRLFTHLRYMVYTTLPALVIALVVYLVVGLGHEAVGESQIRHYSETLSERFYVSPLALVIPLVTGYLIYRRVPSLITLFVGTLLAALYGLAFQGELLREIAEVPGGGWQVLAKGTMQAVLGETNLSMGSEALDELVATRGMAGMMDTVWLILCAMCFGACMTAGGFLEGVTRVFVAGARNTMRLVASTVGAGLFLNLSTADQYISIILTGNMFRNAYRESGHEARLLSRTVEDAVTVTSPLIPWNSCGMTQATVLGVSTWTYLPYGVFNYVCPLMSLVVAATGYKIVRKALPAEVEGAS